MTHTPMLKRWFAAMDSDRPEDVLGMITDDFQLSVLFSGGPGGPVTDFSGDREALVHYLDQRLKDVRRHVVLSGSRTSEDEHVLGEVSREGEWEASFVAVARVTPEGRVRRLLIGRSPGTRFT